MAVDLVTIHHEGAGSPSDDPRGAGGGYTYWIGATRWERLRSVYTSYATLHFNHVSLDICLSGNRVDYPVTDNDVALIHGAFMDAHGRGEVTDRPFVQPHRAINGLYTYHGSIFSTVCPGDKAMLAFPKIIAACSSAPVAPPTDPRVLAILLRMAAWEQAVTKTPLRAGDRGSNVAFLIDLLVAVVMLPAGTFGNAYGKDVIDAVEHFKRTRHLGNTDGTRFGGTVAPVLLQAAASVG